jgi:hypothetical protein
MGAMQFGGDGVAQLVPVLLELGEAFTLEPSVFHTIGPAECIGPADWVRPASIARMLSG